MYSNHHPRHVGFPGALVLPELHGTEAAGAQEADLREIRHEDPRDFPGENHETPGGKHGKPTKFPGKKPQSCLKPKKKRSQIFSVAFGGF